MNFLNIKMRKLEIKSLPNLRTWVDRDIIMFHCCFQILQEFIELENGDTHCNYKAYKELVDEYRFLYNWWLKRKENIYNEKDDEDNEMLERLIKIRETLWT